MEEEKNRKAKHILLNGENRLTNKPIYHYNNEAFLFGNYFNVEISGNSSILFFPRLYFNYIVARAKDFGIQLSSIFKFSIFEKDINWLCQQNRIYKGFNGYITVFQEKKDNFATVLTAVEPNENEYFKFNELGLKMDVLTEKKLPDFFISENLYPFVNYGKYYEKYLSEYNCRDLLLTDNDGNIVKSIYSNVFFVKKVADEDVIFLPDITLNDSSSTIKEFYLERIKELNYKVEYQKIKVSDINDFDEAFLLNSRSGIRWIAAYKDKRFYRKVSYKINEEVNEYLKSYIDERQRK